MLIAQSWHWTDINQIAHGTKHRTVCSMTWGEMGKGAQSKDEESPHLVRAGLVFSKKKGNRKLRKNKTKTRTCKKGRKKWLTSKPGQVPDPETLSTTLAKDLEFSLPLFLQKGNCNGPLRIRILVLHVLVEFVHNTLLRIYTATSTFRHKKRRYSGSSISRLPQKYSFTTDDLPPHLHV